MQFSDNEVRALTLHTYVALKSAKLTKELRLRAHSHTLLIKAEN